eukprot:288729_1
MGSFFGKALETLYGNSEVNFNVFDLGGQDKLRDLWRHYYPGARALIFVIDSTDERRISTAKFELEDVMREHELQNCSWLILCSKQDKNNALNVDEIGNRLDLFDLIKLDATYLSDISSNTLFETYNIPNEILNIIIEYLPPKRSGFKCEHEINIFGCSLITNENLDEAWEWITDKALRRVQHE